MNFDILGKKLKKIKKFLDEITLEIEFNDIFKTCKILKKKKDFQFNQLIDICVIDYLNYSEDEWKTKESSYTGFSRGRKKIKSLKNNKDTRRFCVVYHILSTIFNKRLRLKCFLNNNLLKISSVSSIWKSANWYEREAFDLYGIVFDKHPDLRRILTDYGFKGFPFRKDYPLTGEYECFYDSKNSSVSYKKNKLKNKISIPKIIRKNE